MQMTKWPYPEAEPDFDEVGEFDGWLAGSGSPGKSASAWRVVSKTDPSSFVEKVKLSRPKGTSPRAALGSLVGALEALKRGSSLDCYTRSEYAITAAESIDVWKQRGWQSTDEPLANRDILLRIEEVLRTRQITLRMHHVPKARAPHDEIIETLTRRARGKVRDDAE
ncbi:MULTISPECIES: RNase H family protein [Mesorhizobium]|uniref:RNase H family protein n=1 Tax=Mesorhizobium TaxID=68287 RepID=UPI00145A0285|nr:MULTISPECIES: RNase H family protein [Mesorhizobium]